MCGHISFKLYSVIDDTIGLTLPAFRVMRGLPSLAAIATRLGVLLSPRLHFDLGPRQGASVARECEVAEVCAKVVAQCIAVYFLAITSGLNIGIELARL